jgi:O-antigen/teichoic acid export membrane protein
MIIISLASALATTVIPLLSGARARDDVRSIREQIANVLMLFYFVMMPASLGLAAVAQPIYTIFYRYSAAGTTILIFNAFIGILLGLLTVVSAVMQGISENTKTLKYLGIGLVIKMVIQFPAIWLFQTMGPLLATGISMAITDYLIIHSLNVEFQLPFKKMSKPTNQILVYSLITFVVAKVVVSGAYLVLAPGGRFAAFIVIIPAVALGAGIYVYLMLRSHLADKLLGARVAGLRRRLHIKG